MASSLFFAKRCGGVHWRCGCCGKDQEIYKPVDSAAGLRRVVRDTDKLELAAPGSSPLICGTTLVALICGECKAQVVGELGRIAPRSVVDIDNAANLLGDF